MRTLRLLLVLLMSGALADVTAAQSQPPRQAPGRIAAAKERTLNLLRLLQTPAPEVSFEARPLAEVLEWFRDQGVRNIVVRWPRIEAAGEIDEFTPVTLRLSGVSLGEVLDQVLARASDYASSRDRGLSYLIHGGVLEISRRDDLAADTVVRVYDVEHLLSGWVYWDDSPVIPITGDGAGSGGNAGGGGATGGGGDTPGRRGGGGLFEGGGDAQVDFAARRQERLAALLQTLTSIHPRSWDAEGGPGVVTEFGGKLIITQSQDLHELIGGSRGGR